MHVEHQGYTGPGSPAAAAGSGQQPAAPFLYESGLERTLSLARPEEEQAAVPRMSPRDESSPMLVEILMAVPKPITLSADVVVHYRWMTLKDGMIYLTVAPRNALRYSCDCKKAVRALTRRPASS